MPIGNNPGSGTGDMLASNNLSEVANQSAARANIGLGNVDNTSDANKPISTATQEALGGKVGVSDIQTLTNKTIPEIPVRRTWAKIHAIRNGATTQLRFMRFGDSVAPKQQNYILSYLQKLLGDAGNILSGTTSAVLASGATSADDWTSSPMGSVTSVPSGGTVTWSKSGNTYRCDQIKLYYVKEPGAGTFKVQTASGGSYSDEAGYTNVDASNATKTLGIITLTKTLGNYTLRVVGLTGTVRFISTGFVATTAKGVVNIAFDRGGIPLSDINTCASSIRDALYADLAPDLAMFEMKDSAAIFTAELQNHINYWNAAAPLCDWVYLTTTPTSVGDGEDQNAVMRTICAANGKAVCDTWADAGTYAQLSALSWNGDGTHLADAAYSYLASITLHRMRLVDGVFNIPAFGADPSSSDPLKMLGSFGSAKLALSNALNTLGEVAGGTIYDNSPKWKVINDSGSPALVMYYWNGSNDGTTGQPNMAAFKIGVVGIGGGQYALRITRNYTAAPAGSETYDQTPIYIGGGAISIGRVMTSSESGLIVKGDSVNTGRSILTLERGSDGAVAFQIPGNTGDAAWSYGLTTKSPTKGVGYATGAGATVTQATSKSTGVTLNNVCGQITTHNSALAAGTAVSFTLANSAVAATDVVVVNIASGATAGAYRVTVDAVAASSIRISIRNDSGVSLSEALVLNFAVIKAVAA